MKRIAEDGYREFSALTGTVRFGRVYPGAVTEKLQTGDIFTGGRAVLIWHRCGFAWLLGEYNEAELNELFALKESAGRRLVLFTGDENAVHYFETKGISAGRRLFFEYSGDAEVGAVIPEGYSVREMDRELFGRLEGRVAPRLFWEDAEQFLQIGTGFCLMKNGEPAAWAFTASADKREADIGVETAVEHRGRGLAYAAARLTANEVIRSGRSPVWACDGSNEASRRLAVRLGFEKTAESFIIKLV